MKPKCSRLGQQKCIVSVSAGQESGQSWVMAQGLVEAAVRVSARAAVSSKGLTGEGSTSKLTHVPVGRIRFPWAVAVTIQFLSTWALHRAVYNTAAGFPPKKQDRSQSLFVT